MFEICADWSDSIRQCITHTHAHSYTCTCTYVVCALTHAHTNQHFSLSLSGAYTLNFYVNNDRVANASVVKISHGSAPSVTLVCQSTKADQTLLRSHPTLFEYMQDGSNQTLANEGQDPTHLTHTVDDDSNWHIYLCGYPNIPLIKVTIDFGDGTSHF